MKSVRASVFLLALWALITMLWWGFAFFPVTALTPEWLARTQFVCFGSMPNGLPATYGWFLLVLAPLSLLTGIGFSYADEICSEFLRLRSSWMVRGFSFFVISFFALEFGWVAVRIQNAIALQNFNFDAVSQGPLPENYPRRFEKAPEFHLIDQFGKTVSIASLRGKTVLFTFAFAHCQTVCPSLVHQTLKAFGKNDPAKVAAVFLTLDPWRDTPSSLPDLAKKWELTEGAHVLSGDVPQVTLALDQYKIPWKRDEKTGDVQHPALVYVLDQHGRMAYVFNHPSVEWLADAITRLQSETQ